MDRDEMERRMWAAAIELRGIDCTLAWWRHADDCPRRSYGEECHDECARPCGWSDPPAKEGEECDARRCYDEHGAECECQLDDVRALILAAKAALSGATAEEVDDG